MTTYVCTVSNAPADAVYVGRASSQPSSLADTGGYFGNPFAGAAHGRTAALALFDKYFRARLVTDPAFHRRVVALRGRTLACFCGTKGCHARIIAKWVDAHDDVTCRTCAEASRAQSMNLASAKPAPTSANAPSTGTAQLP